MVQSSGIANQGAALIGFRVIKASLRTGRAHGALRAKLNRQFVFIYIQVTPPRFAQALDPRLGRKAHITAKNHEGPQLAMGAFQAQLLRAAHSLYFIRRLLTLFEPAQAFSVTVTTLEVWEVCTNETPGDRKRASSHRIWTRFLVRSANNVLRGRRASNAGPSPPWLSPQICRCRGDRPG